MEQSPSWEANWFAANQEIPRILWNPKVHYRTHKRPLSPSSSASKTFHWFWPFAPDNSKLFCLRRLGSNFSVPVSLNHLSLRLSIFSLAVLLVLTPIGFQSVILTSFVSFILLRCPHHIIICAFIYLTLSSHFIVNF